MCNENCINNRAIIRDNSYTIFFNKINNNINVYSCFTGLCRTCHLNIGTEVDFGDNLPNFIFIEAAHLNIFFNDLPKELEFNNRKFRLLCGTVIIPQRNHYVGIVELNSNLYVIDGIGRRCTYLPPNNTQRRTRLSGIETHYSMNITTTLYYLI